MEAFFTEDGKMENIAYTKQRAGTDTLLLLCQGCGVPPNIPVCYLQLLPGQSLRQPMVTGFARRGGVSPCPAPVEEH